MGRENVCGLAATSCGPPAFDTRYDCSGRAETTPKLQGAVPIMFQDEEENNMQDQAKDGKWNKSQVIASIGQGGCIWSLS